MRLFALLFLSLFIFTSTATAKDYKFSYDVGDDPPRAKLGRSLSKVDVNLDEMKGKVVVITFWATWCVPCLKEMPVLNAIQKQVSTENLQVVAINFGESTRASRNAKKVLKGTNILFTSDRRKKIGKRYGVKGIPHMVILDRNGKVADIRVGYGENSIDPLVDKLNELLRQQASAD